jgi:3-oxoacyl-[acyl-carrier-protein] synthase I
MKIELAITGVGLLSPIGHSALAGMHAVRSDQSGLSLLRLPDRVRNWVAGGKIPQWTPYGGHRHWETLAVTALQQAWHQANRGAPLPPEAPIALVLGRPDAARPSPVFPRAGFDISAWAQRTLGRAPAHIDLVQAGACNAHAGLRLAAQRFAAGTAQACLIGAADSQAQLRVTRWHEDKLRLKCSYVTDGLAPSEAAAFMMVEPLELAARRGALVLARVNSLAVGKEDATVLSDLPNTAAAMSQVAQSALLDACVQASELGMVWSDLNGESYKAREWAFTAVRMGLCDSTRLMHPADCHGDLGAATDTHLLGLAAMAQATAWSNKPMLVFSGSDSGLRAATVVCQGDRRAGIVAVSGNEPHVMSTRFKLPTMTEEPQDFRETDDPTKAWFTWQTCHAQQDDIAGLFYQRRAMLADAETPWHRLAEPEARLMRHFDAVVAAGPQAMAFQASGLFSDEEGLAFGAALLIGQIPSSDNLALTEAALAEAKGSRLNGLMEGLMHSPLSTTLQSTLTRWLESDTPTLRMASLRLLGGHRIAVAPPVAINEFLRSPDVAVEVAEASWRLGWTSLAPALKNLLADQQVELRQSALTALICFVPARAAMFCRSRLPENLNFGGALATGLAMCGSLDDAALLRQFSAKNPNDLAAIEALGVLGSKQALPTLIDLLGSENPLATACAEESLRLITGHNAGSDLHEWQRWLADEGASLNPSTRWRHGLPFSPAACVAELANPASPITQRRRAHRELARWIGSGIPYEPDAFAIAQARAIDEMRA